MTVDQMNIAAEKGACLGMYCANFETGLMWSWEEFRCLDGPLVFVYGWRVAGLACRPMNSPMRHPEGGCHGPKAG
jgi:hypothetical protein